MAMGLNSDDWSNRTWIILGVILLVFIAGVIFLAPKALKMAGWS
jgi:hypothetical protein